MEKGSFNILLQKINLKEEGKEKVFSFFLLFSRFEFALKKIDRYANGDEQGVSADWGKFASEINGEFNRNGDEKLKKAVDYLLSRPPRKQIKRDGKLDWKDRNENCNDIIKLKTAICDIRNNLVHGEKINETFNEDGCRNAMLVDSAFIILNNWIELNEEVKKSFLADFS